MNNKLLFDAGESYEYVKTIVENKLELAKINATQRFSKMIGNIILATILLLITAILIMTSLVVFCYYIIISSGSIMYGTLVFSFLLFLFGFLVFIFRKSIIYKPITNFLYSHIMDEL